MLDERKEKILLAIIQDYIATAEPVGSRTISRKYELGVSPATIRNEMADLDEMGLIEQPYTSAGRIPSDKGYRYYVDFLMEKYPLSAEVQQAVRERFKRKLSDLEEVIRTTGELLSHMTDYIAITLGPQVKQSALRHIELSRISESRGLLVVVTDSGAVEHRFFDLPESVTAEELKAISEVLTQKLMGITLDRVTKTVLEEIYINLAVKRRLLDAILNIIENILSESDETKVFFCGTSNILKQPEFKNIEKLQFLLSFLEEERLVKDLVSQQLLSEGLTIKIGGENNYEGVHDCSLITAAYHVGGEVVGTVSVLGPTRMDYSKAVAVVEFVTEALSETLTKYYR
ncbi:MAG TPA: HrcA family transcriptional regulator [Peptococcaceae bacterium]|nr:MAG: Heat-inducible transcription repressor HrcA [Clostridia bacterium 41_269]HBT20318.1 HrcA family transcriptional regulator [Peptococcaceae bacterium]